MPIAVLALTAGAFGIGTTEFVIMGLLLQVAADLHVSIAAAGPADLRLCARRLRRRAAADASRHARCRARRCCSALMAIFTLGNARLRARAELRPC